MPKGYDKQRPAAVPDLPKPGICVHCGSELLQSTALVNTGGTCVRMLLGTHCPSKECHDYRSMMALQRAIVRGVIDP